MQTIRIATTQHVDIDYEVAGLGERILARLADLGILLAVYLFSVYLLFSSGSGGNVFTYFQIVFSVIAALYDLLCEVFFNGQSIGKRILKIKVISLNGARPTVSQYLLRWVFRMVDFLVTFQLGALIAVAVTKNKQRIGDIVAQTTLVRTHPKTNLDQLSFNVPLEENYEPVYKEVQELRDEDINLVKEVLDAYRQTGNTSLLYNLGSQISGHLKLKPLSMTDPAFLTTVLKDYAYFQNRAGEYENSLNR